MTIEAERERLRQLAARIDRLSLEPGSVEAPWTTRLSRPFLRWVGWQAHYESVALGALFESLDADDKLGVTVAAIDELEENIAKAEKVCSVHGDVAVAQLAWLGRVRAVLDDVSLAVAFGGEAGQDTLRALDPVLAAPPLMIRDAEATRRPAPIAGAGEAEAPRRLVELQLAAIDSVIAAARQEKSFLERRRSLLEAARRLLLDASTTLPLDDEGVRLRKRYLAEKIVEVDRLQAVGLEPRVALAHQAHAALSRGERDRLHAALVAMAGFGSAAGDPRLVAQAEAGLAAMSDGGQTPAARDESLARSAAEIFGDEVQRSLATGYGESFERLAAMTPPKDAYDREMHELALTYLAPGSDGELMNALVSADGCFDVGAPLAPVRVTERHTVARLVRHPTREMTITVADDAADLPNAIIRDPRSIVLDLAAGRLLCRRFVSYEERSEQRIELRGEVRIYLVDGSTSMLTDGVGAARARMRDAILIAELATLLRRFEESDRHTRVILYYRHFTKRQWPVHRVATPAQALAAIGDVATRAWNGGTDIQTALCDCFETIRSARAADPWLSRAQIVLITDGQANVDFEAVTRAREVVGELPLAVSVVALGEENAALRALVARQRERGERAFYHYIDDVTLGELCAGRIAGSRPLHVTHGEASLPALRKALRQVLDDVTQLESERHAQLRQSPAALAASMEASTAAANHELGDAHRELGLAAPPPELTAGGELARAEAIDRDSRALDQRFRRWFPSEVAEAPEHETDVEAVIVLLATVAEVVGELGTTALERRADAVEILHRLLPDARLSPQRYLDALGGPEVAAALEVVHDAVERRDALVPRE